MILAWLIVYPVVQTGNLTLPSRRFFLLKPKWTSSHWFHFWAISHTHLHPHGSFFAWTLGKVSPKWALPASKIFPFFSVFQGRVEPECSYPLFFRLVPLPPDEAQFLYFCIKAESQSAYILPVCNYASFFHMFLSCIFCLFCQNATHPSEPQVLRHLKAFHVVPIQKLRLLIFQKIACIKYSSRCIFLSLEIH